MVFSVEDQKAIERLQAEVTALKTHIAVLEGQKKVLAAENARLKGGGDTPLEERVARLEELVSRMATNVAQELDELRRLCSKKRFWRRR